MTPKQREALAYVKKAKRWVAGPELARALSTSPQGAAATASSLVRRGLLARGRMYGHVVYTARSGR